MYRDKQPYDSQRKLQYYNSLVQSKMNFKILVFMFVLLNVAQFSNQNFTIFDKINLCSIIFLMKVTTKQSASSPPAQVYNQTKANSKPNYFQMKSYAPDGILQELAYMLIRPPRFIYNPNILIPNKHQKQKFTVQQYSIPFELTVYSPPRMRYVLLYLHGNGSSRFEGFLFLKSLPEGVGLACFDFAGCGNRYDRDFITLGQQQSKDVDVAARFLKQKGLKVVGWGRSMGAVSLLMSSECDIMVSDSAYSNLSALCKQQSSKFLPKACCCVFQCVFPCVFGCIRCKVNSLSTLSIDQMDVAGQLRKLNKLGAKKEICFIHGEEDTLINSSHAQSLYNAYEGRKMLVYFAGTHNSTRPTEVINRCFQFIEEGINNLKYNLNSYTSLQNHKINKMVELQQHNTKFQRSLNQSPPNPKQETIIVSPSKMQLAMNAVKKQQEVLQVSKVEESVRVHTEYSNGKSSKGIHSPFKKQGQEQGGDKRHIISQICDQIQKNNSIEGSELKSNQYELNKLIEKQSQHELNTKVQRSEIINGKLSNAK